MKLYYEALSIKEKVLGKEHPSYALQLNNIAHLLSAKVGLYGTHVVELSLSVKGDYAEAEKLQREGLKISEKVYGKEHPDYALKLNNLAGLLRAQVQLVGFCC